MDNNQARIIELLREVHLLAFKEVERLNLRITELEHQNRQPVDILPVKPTVKSTVERANIRPFSPSNRPEMLNDVQVAEYLNMSVGTLRRWRLFRRGPKFVKIGCAVRYKREDVDAWLSSCPGLP